VLFGLGLEIGQLDVALVVAGFTATTLKPAITALAGLVPWAEVGIRQTFRWPFAPGLVVGANDQKAGVLALGARVGLQRDRRRSR
jgi:hypothetical protein